MPTPYVEPSYISRPGSDLVINISDLEMWDRARDNDVGTPTTSNTGQAFIPSGYTTTVNDPTAYPTIIGTGTAARMTTTANSSPLGVFAQFQLTNQVLHMRARFTINPNTTNAGGTVGTVDTGTIGLIMWEPGFNGNGSSPNVYSPCHLSFNATGFTYGCIYDPGSHVPTFAALKTVTYANPLTQDGTTIHSGEVVIDPNALNDSGGRGLAYVYAPDGNIYKVSNNAIGIVPTATVASFEIYKASTAQRLAEFVEIGADSKRTDRILRARRDYGINRTPGRNVAGPANSIMLPDRIHTTTTQTTATSGRTSFMPIDIGPMPLKIKGLAVNVVTAQVAGTGTLVKGAIYADNSEALIGVGGPLLSTAGKLGEITFTATTTGILTGTFATPITLQPGRYWLASFYYAGSVAPTTIPLLTTSGGSTTLFNLSGSFLVVRSLIVTGTTDLPVASQTAVPNSDAQNVITAIVAN
jgi:hypothetical protein